MTRRALIASCDSTDETAILPAARFPVHPAFSRSNRPRRPPPLHPRRLQPRQRVLDHRHFHQREQNLRRRRIQRSRRARRRGGLGFSGRVSRVMGRNLRVKLSARRMAWSGGGRVRSSESSPRGLLCDTAAAAERCSPRRFRCGLSARSLAPSSPRVARRWAAAISWHRFSMAHRAQAE
jgi:hypothetical protein